MDAVERQVEQNLFAFLPQIPDLLREHAGDYAVLRNQKVRSLHRTLSEAIASAENAFDDRLYSIQQVTDRPIELGFFSYANNSG